MTELQRLYQGFQPEHYSLELMVDRKGRTFSGQVTIQGHLSSSELALHQKELEIVSLAVAGQDCDFVVEEEQDLVRAAGLEPGDVSVVVNYRGKINDRMTGIYPSYYRLDGQDKEIISTQFESHFAREAFPCIDEPEAKATFDLTLRFDQVEGEIALSNMPEQVPGQGAQTGVWTFERTPRMSTYLLAFGIGDLQGITDRTERGTLVGVYASKAHPERNLEFALDIAKRVIAFYEDYFDVPYPIPQSLHLALPDFSSGAMENWGLVTYREVYLLVDANSSFHSRQQVALVIAHEVAHQWFGNLVTMEWWDDLWLNESFANMMEYVSVDHLEPGWNILEDFQTSGIPLSLRRDATDGVQSVHVQVNHPDEVNTLFDPAIVYAKGSRLMHMLHRWLGDQAFSQGLGDYFRKHQYGNTVGADLWAALEAASGKEVGAFMESWLEQPGYPVVTVTLEGDDLVLTQEQFFLGQGEDKGRLWHIPLNSNWQGLPDMMTTERLVIPGYAALVAANAEAGALRLNDGNTAHYICDYQGPIGASLVENIAGLDAISRLQLVQEQQLLAEAGRISYASLVALMEKWPEEKAFIVLSAWANVVRALARFVDQDKEAQAALNQKVSQLFGPAVQTLGVVPQAGEAEQDELVRQVALGQLVEAGDVPVVEEVAVLFEQYQDHLEDTPASIRSQVLINQMKSAESAELVELYLTLYKNATDGTFQRQLATALSYAQEEEHLQLLLSKWQDKAVVKPQDLAMSWYRAFLLQAKASPLAWDWAGQNWDWIVDALGGDMSFDKYIIYPANSFHRQDQLQAYKDFFQPKLDDLSMQRNIIMGMNEIEARVALMERDREQVLAALKAN